MNLLSRLFLAFTILLVPALPQAFAQDSKATTAPAAAQDKVLTVFAAASMKNALDEVNAAYTAKSGVKVCGQLRRQFGSRQAARARCAGRHLHLRRYRLDGLLHRQEDHQ